MPGPIDRLLEIMAALRQPETGCPWDVKQDFSTIAPYTIEEAYEVSDAIERRDMEGLREELGDLLLQVVFHAQMASEAGVFGFDDVAAGICEKMVERHPHVFRQRADISESDLRDAWESRKEAERRRKGNGDSAMDDIALALPALMRAQKQIRRAARKGFDWASADDALDKCREELEEMRAAARDENVARAEEELGDLLLACVAAANKLGLDAEKSLRRANDKFARRFRCVESSSAKGDGNLEDASVDELRRLWNDCKQRTG